MGGPPPAPSLLSSPTKRGGPPPAPSLLNSPTKMGGPPLAPNLLSPTKMGGPPMAPNLLAPPPAPSLSSSPTKIGGPPTAPNFLLSPTKQLFGGTRSDFLNSETSSMISSGISSGISTPMTPSLLSSQVLGSQESPNQRSSSEYDYYPTTPRPLKLRALFWEKIGNYEVNKSLWLAVHLNKTRINVKFEDLYQTFVDSKETIEIKQRIAATCVFIEDEKRIQKMEFPVGKMLTLKKLKWPEIMKALSNFNYKKLGLETMYGLLPIIPTPDEIERAQRYNGDPETLDNPSRWIYESSQIKNFGKRLKLFKFAMDFYNDAKKDMSSIKIIISVCKTIRNNQYFLEFLRQILLCGNILAEGTRRGDAMGFRVIAFRCLLTCLGKDGKTTMLQYVMQKIYEQDQDFFHWLPKIIKEIETGSFIDIDALITSTSNLKENFGDIMDELEEIEASQRNDSGFIKFFKPFYLNNVDIAIDLENRAKDIKEYFIDTALKMGEKPFVLKDKTTEDIFKDWKKYFVEIQNCLKLVVAFHKVNKSVGLQSLIRTFTLGDSEKSGTSTKLSSLMSNPQNKEVRSYKAKKE